MAMLDSTHRRRSLPVTPKQDFDLQNWGGWIRTTDLLINSQALCQLSYTPKLTSSEPVI